MNEIRYLYKYHKVQFHLNGCDKSENMAFLQITPCLFDNDPHKQSLKKIKMVQ